MKQSTVAMDRLPGYYEARRYRDTISFLAIEFFVLAWKQPMGGIPEPPLSRPLLSPLADAATARTCSQFFLNVRDCQRNHGCRLPFLSLQDLHCPMVVPKVKPTTKSSRCGSKQ